MPLAPAIFAATPFLLNLAAADLLVLVVFVPVFIAYEAMDFVCPFGSFWCKSFNTHLYVRIAGNISSDSGWEILYNVLLHDQKNSS